MLNKFNIFGVYLALLACLVPSGCTSGDSENQLVRLSWRFVDSRPCDLAGVQNITVIESLNRLELRCLDGMSPDHHQEITLTSVPVTLTLGGQSVTGAVLYEGTTEITSDDLNDEVVVTLRFVGGRSQ